MKNRRDAIVTLFSAAIAPSLFASAANATPLTGAALNDAINRASAAINALGRIEGSFIQTNPNQTSNSGKFWLNRPGKMRFEYDTPSPLLLVSDGSNMIVVDKRLRTTERYPLRTTPLYFLLKQGVNLARDVNVASAENINGRLIMVLRDKQNQANGELRLVFAPNMQLEEWAIRDRQNRTTNIRISNVRNSGALPASHFSVPMPRRTGAPSKG